MPDPRIILTYAHDIERLATTEWEREYVEALRVLGRAMSALTATEALNWLTTDILATPPGTAAHSAARKVFDLISGVNG